MAGHPLTPLRVIGFDVRRSVQSAAALLMPEERRNGSLIDPDCARIASADRSIWPSMFSLQGREPWPASFPDLTPVAVAPETAYFSSFELWPDLASMHAAHMPGPQGDLGIALALLLPPYYQGAFRSDSWFEAITSPGATPGTPASDWPFLGFDVVNSGLQSALSGFGPLDEIGELRAAWSGDLNECHLLHALPRALDFCEDANQRLASDGPFFVVALFLFWDSSDELAHLATSLAADGPAS